MTRRDYGQFCGLAAGMNVIGERWTLLIVRELFIGEARFKDLLHNLPGIGTNLLADRLKTLVNDGVVEDVPVAGDGRARAYRLTPVGEGLREPVLALAKWGLSFLQDEDSAGAVRPEWGLLALQSMVDESRTPDVPESYEFRVGSDVFHVTVEPGSVGVARGPCESPDLVVHCEPTTFIRIGAQLINPVDALASGELTMTGDAAVVQHCTRLLGLS
ncbi:helix-turn-helix domain-containing protein [Prauserella halophila]|uniref:Helix-turn-helix domain-containing protein n=1 Tax=Prauserella halophila TaxID=185641 RepID=A0ABP4GVG6_9PSEU|nr:winged helix-turn-helix transcriptional regulator [Prauserella halophila]MCP2234889.1 transcriptional regulator, HxlR family [Prauserella halophila]